MTRLQSNVKIPSDALIPALRRGVVTCFHLPHRSHPCAAVNASRHAQAHADTAAHAWPFAERRTWRDQERGAEAENRCALSWNCSLHVVPAFCSVATGRVCVHLPRNALTYVSIARRASVLTRAWFSIRTYINIGENYAATNGATNKV